MKFKYTARTQDGELQTGFVEAANRATATTILGGHNLFILSLEGAESISWFEGLSHFFNRVKLRDLMVFTRQFAVLIEAEVPLNDTLVSLSRYTRNPLLSESISEVSSNIAAGLSLSQAMERQPNVFSEFYVNMIRSAEITGRLERAMSFLADYLEKEVAWRGRITNALIYPAFLIAMFFVVAIVMTVFVFPQIAPIFEESSIDIPLITKVILGTTSFILNWWFLLIAVLAMFAAVVWEYFHTPEGKAVFHELLIKTPVLGDMFRKMYVARFAESASVLLKGGIPLAQAVEISGRSMGSVIYQDILHDVAEGVRAGEPLSALLLQNEYFFPSLVAQMTAVGENTGRLDELLNRVSVFYTRETEDILGKLAELIQPIILLLIGAGVGILFASILVPIYNLAQGI